MLQLLDMKTDELYKLLPARASRKLKKGLPRKHTQLIKKLRKAKTATEAGERCHACHWAWLLLPAAGTDAARHLAVFMRRAGRTVGLM